MKYARLAATGLATAGIALGSAGVANAAPAALPTADADFLVAAHQGNLTEIAAGAAAFPLASCPEVRQIGTTLIADHVQLEASGAATAVRNGVTLPLTPSRSQIDTLVSVTTTPPPGFDRVWLQAQRDAHVATLQAIRNEIANGRSDDVTAVARAAEPIVEHHLMMVEDAQGKC